MKTFLKFRMMGLALILSGIFMACSEDENNGPEQSKVNVSIKDSRVDGMRTLKFTVASQNADKVCWYVVEGKDNVPDAAFVLAEGTAVEANKDAEVSFDAEKYSTLYTVVAAAAGGSENVSAKVELTTSEEPDATPVVTLAPGEAGESTLAFTVTTADAEEARWVCIVKDSRDLTAEQVLKNGTPCEVNTSQEIVADGLAPETEYGIFVAARNGEVTVLSDPLYMTTTEAAPVYENYTVNGSSAYATITEGDPMNWYIAIYDAAQGYSFKADVYASAENLYMPSGEYPLGEMAAGYTSINYTSFMNENTDVAARKFKAGSMDVEAIADEQAGTLTYRINGEFELAEGGIVTVTYEGEISGINLPQEEEDLSVMTFVPVAAERKYYPSDPAGYYTLFFRDSEWNELYVEIAADPSACNQGTGALPNGTYSLSGGTLTDYTKVTYYNPYFGGVFESASVEVSGDGENYVIDFEGVAIYSGASIHPERTIRMKYEGTVTGMIPESL